MPRTHERIYTVNPYRREMGEQSGNSQKGFNPYRCSYLLIERQCDVLVGDVVYLLMSERTSLYG